MKKVEKIINELNEKTIYQIEKYDVKGDKSALDQAINLQYEVFKLKNPSKNYLKGGLN
ncbi:MAG: hypothetical protein KC516_01460 [Nanoarchaeota archaeon]|nr:hypothetical protein [Nanoarchaeota archaeon]